jgi:hypothetical protein
MSEQLRTPGNPAVDPETKVRCSVQAFLLRETEQAVKAIKAHIAKGDRAAEKSEQHYIAAGQLEHESASAKAKIHELQKKHGLSWNDVLELISEAGNDDAARKLFDALFKKAPKQADILIELAGEASFFRTADGAVWADIDVGHRESWPVRNRAFSEWLRHRFFKTEKTAPNKESIEACLCHVEAVARFSDAPRREVFVRIAGLGFQIYLDLCDDNWTAIQIDASGWRAVKDPPVRFFRTAGMLPLPIPETGGTLSDLRSLLHLGSADDFIILVGWLLGALRGRPPYPVLAMAGPPGASKSTAIGFLRDLVDPHEVKPGALPREARDLSIAARKRFIQAFDNLSGIPAEVSDMLCRLSTGGGFVIRSLYTNDEETVFSHTRPIILAGIEDVAGRHDLADRTSSLLLEHIPEHKKKLLSELQASFERARPRILGCLLTVVAQGLRNLPHTQLGKYPRMADYAHWMAACETAVWEPGTFARAYAANKAALAAASLEADIVATLVVDMLNGGLGWSGTAKDLLVQVNNRASDQQKRDKHWPKTPRGMTSRLRRASEVLREHGWAVEFSRAALIDRTRIITITPASDKSAQQPCRPSRPSKAEQKQWLEAGRSLDGTDAVHPEPSNNRPIATPCNDKVLDGLDGLDGSKPNLSGAGPCAYCGATDPPPQACSWNGKTVRLHLNCEEYWTRLQEHEAGAAFS